MSSFIISKENYMKAAGLVAGLQKSLNLWLFNYEKGHNMTAEEIKNTFSDIYNMNYISVCEQYKEPFSGSDDFSYDETFRKYFNYGNTIGISRENLKETILELHSFFDGCAYQIEKESYFFKTRMFYQDIESKLLKYMLPGYETESWSELKIKEPKTIYKSLF